MARQALSAIRETIISYWKLCLSFRKRDWDLSDYPIRIRKNLPIDLDLGPRFKQEIYLAQVLNWWSLSGSGDTPQDAMVSLANSFKSIKADRQQLGKPVPRPGTSVPVEFNTQEHVSRHADLAEDFIQQVLGLDWAWISDGSSLWDFHSNDTNDAMFAKISQVYGVDVSDIESGNLAKILDRIAASRS